MNPPVPGVGIIGVGNIFPNHAQPFGAYLNWRGSLRLLM